MCSCLCVCLCADPNADQQKRTQCCGGRLGHAAVRRFRGHERILAGLLEFGFWWVWVALITTKWCNKDAPCIFFLVSIVLFIICHLSIKWAEHLFFIIIIFLLSLNKVYTVFFLFICGGPCHLSSFINICIYVHIYVCLCVTDTMAWSLLYGSQQGSSGPGPRHSHSAVAYQSCMYLFGGLKGLREQRDFWKWNSTSHMWTSLKNKWVQMSPVSFPFRCKLGSRAKRSNERAACLSASNLRETSFPLVLSWTI